MADQLAGLRDAAARGEISPGPLYSACSAELTVVTTPSGLMYPAGGGSGVGDMGLPEAAARRESR